MAAQVGEHVSATTAGVDPPADRSTWCRLQVLVVDDSPAVRELIGAMLERTGRFDLVVQAGDGNEAIGLAEVLQPDLVLLDLAMPGLGGLEALPLVRAVAPLARVVVLSGSPEDEMAVEVLTAGAVGYLQKGPDMDLAGVIDAVLGAPGGQT